MKLTSTATFSGSTYGGLRHWQVKKLTLNRKPPMSALGQKQTSKYVCAMSALLPKADMVQHYAIENARLFEAKAAAHAQIDGIAGVDFPARRHVSLLFSTWTEPISQVRSTATGTFVTRPRATVLPLI
jgi:hypothetical protein